MNIHEAIDVGTISLTALLVRDAKFFARNRDAEPLIDVAADADAVVEDLTSAGRTTVSVETSVGTFEAAYMPWQWRGPDYPTLVYHHGSGERPFDFGRFSSHSFRRLFVDSEASIPANVIAVRAPFHDRSNMDYARAMGDLRNFVGMLAASTALIDALAAAAREQTETPVIASGISLGGWVVNLHRACRDHVDRYAPIFAGAALGEMFVSSIYGKMVARAARNRPQRLRDVLDFEADFRAVEREDCAPLLARYDRIIEFDRQRPSYDGHPVSVLEHGHVTGSLATARLRAHVLEAIATA
jgi:hypothetical protein